MGFMSSKRAGLSILRLQDEWARQLAVPGSISYLEMRPIPRLAFGAAHVAKWMISVESGHFVLEDTTGTFLPDLVVNERIPLAPVSAPGRDVWAALIEHLQAQVTSAEDTSTRANRLETLSWFARIEGNVELERHVAVDRARLIVKHPPENPQAFDSQIRRLDELRLLKAAALVRTQRAAVIARLAVADESSVWTLGDAEQAYVQAIEALESVGLSESAELAREAIETIRVAMQEADH